MRRPESTRVVGSKWQLTHSIFARRAPRARRSGVGSTLSWRVGFG